MKLADSRNRTPAAADATISRILDEVSPRNLRGHVEMLAFPRHYFAEHRANRKARDLLLKHASSLGYTPALEGSFDNIVMTSGGELSRSLLKYARQASLVAQPTLPGPGLQLWR